MPLGQGKEGLKRVTHVKQMGKQTWMVSATISPSFLPRISSVASATMRGGMPFTSTSSRIISTSASLHSR